MSKKRATTAKFKRMGEKVKTGRVQKAKTPEKKVTKTAVIAPKEKRPAAKPTPKAARTGSDAKPKAAPPKARAPQKGTRKARTDWSKEEDTKRNEENDKATAKRSKASPFLGVGQGPRALVGRRTPGERVEKTKKSPTTNRSRGSSKEQRTESAKSASPGKRRTASLSPSKSLKSSTPTAGKKSLTQPAATGLVETAQEGAEMVGNVASATAEKASDMAKNVLHGVRALSEGAAKGNHARAIMQGQVRLQSI